MIEDVQYLQNVGALTSVTVLVDSSKRDRSAYPKASFYSLPLRNPLRMVVGCEILDASIPSPQYNVYSDNNLICMTEFALGPHVTIATAYDLHRELSYMTDFQSKYLPIPDPNKFTTHAYVVSPEQLATFQNAVFMDPVVPDTQPFDGAYVVCVRHVVADVALDQYTVPPRPDAIEFDGMYYIGGVLLPPQRSSFLYQKGGGMYDVVWYDLLQVRQDQIYVVDSLVLQSMLQYVSRLTYKTFTIVEGNYTIITLAQFLQTTMDSMTVNPVTALVYDVENRLKFSASYPFLFDMRRSTCRAVLGFDEYANDSESVGNYIWVRAKANSYVFAAPFVATTNKYEINTPGIINLLGNQYLTIRCQELDDHIHAGRSYDDLATGLGVMKLATFNDVANLRFDFVNLVRKPFHPIGKLSRLTFRFEMNDGNLYDFKGLNHQMLLSFKVLTVDPSAGGKMPFRHSSLNPNYNADFLSYIIDNRHSLQCATDRERRQVDVERYEALQDEYDYDTDDENASPSSSSCSESSGN